MPAANKAPAELLFKPRPRAVITWVVYRGVTDVLHHFRTRKTFDHPIAEFVDDLCSATRIVFVPVLVEVPLLQ